MEIVNYYIVRVAAIIDKGDINIPQTEFTAGPDGTIATVLRVVFGVAGGVALIMVVIGGLRYINSLGNAQNVAKAKDTILYAIIGLVVCILGFAIVNFVTRKTL